MVHMGVSENMGSVGSCGVWGDGKRIFGSRSGVLW